MPRGKSCQFKTALMSKASKLFMASADTVGVLSAYPSTSRQSTKMGRSKRLWDKLLGNETQIPIFSLETCSFD